MIETINIVIGSNYGDEGKGLWTDYISFDQVRHLNNPIVILCNGGPQRGHTVNIKNDNINHVFHHFGSGTLLGVPTYFSKSFVVNPLLFRQEYEDLLENKIPIVSKDHNPYISERGKMPIIYANTNCMVTTPFDMILNQIRMAKDNKHNSCGVGVWDTIDRYNNSDINTEFGKISSLTIGEYKNIIDNNPDKLFTIFSELLYRMIEIINKSGLELGEWKFVKDDSANMINNYISDLKFMINNVVIVDSGKDSKLNKYNSAIIEMGQGLLLSKDKDQSFGTSSNINLESIIYYIMDDLFLYVNHVSITVNYITRWYNTRHGDGGFTEFDLSKDIYKKLVDMIYSGENTNTYNEFQGRFRIGPLDFDKLVERLRKDYDPGSDFSKHLSVSELITPQFLIDTSRLFQIRDITIKNSEDEEIPIRLSGKLVVTHMDEYEQFMSLINGTDDSDFLAKVEEYYDTELIYGNTR